MSVFEAASGPSASSGVQFLLQDVQVINRLLSEKNHLPVLLIIDLRGPISRGRTINRYYTSKRVQSRGILMYLRFQATTKRSPGLLVVCYYW